MTPVKQNPGSMITAAAVLTVLIVTFLPALALGVGTEVILEDSFENPDVTGKTGLEPAGWIQTPSTSHPLYVGLMDEENGQYFTTPFGSQAVNLYFGSGAAMETSASILPETLLENTTYTLTFNVSRRGDNTQGNYKAEFVAVDEATGGRTLLASAAGVVTQTDMSETASLSFTTTDDHTPLLGQRLILVLRMDPDAPNYRFSVLVDNVKLTKTCLPPEPSDMITVPGADGGGCDDDFQISAGETKTTDYVAFLNSADAAGSLMVADGKVADAATGDAYCLTTAAKTGAAVVYNADAAPGERFTPTANRDNHPMVFVSWIGAAAYCNWKSDQSGTPAVYDSANDWNADMTAPGYRLPTETEWYKAAAFDPETAQFSLYGNNKNEISRGEANFLDSGDPAEGNQPAIMPYASYPAASAYGLYDTSGNAWEWCQNNYGDNAAVKAARGGGWGNVPQDIKTTSRIGFKSNMMLDSVGFRVVLPAARP
ncbi:MAG: SUMF1/EgtB/PvdO family nonheme iron enzyme [Lentisphaeria bacterium]|nr:SUMF1/EgtB/PvdO family nonheme iron enzyme [Lentisphaeria bacterium]